MKLSIIIPTRGTKQQIENSIARLRVQSFQDFECFFVVDNTHRESYMKDQGNFRFLFAQKLKNASALRNQGMHQAQGDFLLFMDDDERGDASYLEQNFSVWHSIREEIQKDFVLCPTLFWRMTEHIQSQGFSSYNWTLSRPSPCIFPSPSHLKKNRKSRMYLCAYSGNSLFGPAPTMKQTIWNEQFDFVYEDIEYTYHLSKHSSLIVSRELELHHLERDKTRLEHARVGNIYQAYRKAKHRCFFVRLHGNRYQKLAFFSLGFWAQPLWLIGKVFWRGKRGRFAIIGAILRGTRDGFRDDLTSKTTLL